MKAKHLLNNIIGKKPVVDADTTLRTQEADIEAFIANPENPFLVSFPRTGSHWLRMIMELYFQRPTLVRAFYYPERSDYLMLHTHDLELDVQRSNVIYLYREPVATVYSQMQYYAERMDDQFRVDHWSELYGQHLNKWLCQEGFTRQKTILKYEVMQRDISIEFAKVAAHFGSTLDIARLEAVSQQVTKDEVKRKTAHDNQVIQLDNHYQILREEFRSKYSARIWASLTKNRQHLLEYFENVE